MVALSACTHLLGVLFFSHMSSVRMNPFAITSCSLCSVILFSLVILPSSTLKTYSNAIFSIALRYPKLFLIFH